MYSLPSILPSLYDWSYWVPFIFRLFLAYELYKESQRIMRGESTTMIPVGKTPPTLAARKTLAWLILGLSASFFFGLGIQIVGTCTAIIFLFRIFQAKKDRHETIVLRDYMTICALVAFSLLFLGPGPYAIDLPL
jgi:hypothetical protein